HHGIMAGAAPAGGGPGHSRRFAAGTDGGRQHAARQASSQQKQPLRAAQPAASASAERQPARHGGGMTMPTKGGKGGRTDPRSIGRGPKVRVKTAKKRSTSSTRWLERQLNDPYVAAAQRAGYRSRAAYQLLEMNDKYGFLKGAKRVVDLGAAPGGWTQVVGEVCGPQTKIVGIDLLPVDPIPGAEIIQLDFLAPDAEDRLIALLGGPADVVL